jgi:hypothetical protein
MFAIVNNGIIEQLIPDGSQFTIGGTEYPSNWVNLSTPEEKAAIGMVDVVYGQSFSDTYYWVTQEAPVYNAVTNQVDINFTSIPKDLFVLQNDQVSATNNTAYTILLPSDWMVVKAIETSTTVAPSWNTWRQEIRDQAAEQVAKITACVDVAELAALPPVAWLPDPDHPVTEPTTPIEP